jgi:transposase
MATGLDQVLCKLAMNCALDRRTQRQVRIHGRVEHPASHSDNNAGLHFDVDDLTGSPALAVLPAHPVAEQRVPTIEDLDFLPDMGGMNLRWPSDATTGCSPGSLRAGKRAAAVMSLVQSARLNGHDPYAYLRDVVERLPTQPASRVGELLPHRWQAP